MTDCQAPMIEIGDWLLGWTLGWPRDLTLLAVACVTSATLLAIRRLVGSQSRLRCIADDERRLRRLIAAARSHGDTEAVNRSRQVRRLVAGRRLGAELLPALVGLLPALLIVTWGAQRLDCVPLPTEEPFDFSVTLPASAVGSLTYIVPQPGLSADEGWVRPVELASKDSTPLGHTSWRLRVESADAVDRITLRHRDMTLEHPVMFDGRTYPRETIAHEGDFVTRLRLETYKPLGCVPGFEALGLRPWLVGLLGLTLACYLGAKRALHMP